MKRQFTSLRKQKSGSGVHLRVGKVLAPRQCSWNRYPQIECGFGKLAQNGFKIWHLQINYLKNLCSFFIIFSLISLCGKKHERIFYRSVALNILNTIKMFNTTNRTSRFLFKDNCNSSKNPSSVIRNYIPKIILFKLHIFALLLFFVYFFICPWKT